MINKIEIKGSVFTIFTFFKKNRKLDYLTIKKYINNGVNVYPVQYLGLCKSLDIDINKHFY